MALRFTISARLIVKPVQLCPRLKPIGEKVTLLLRQDFAAVRLWRPPCHAMCNLFREPLHVKTLSIYTSRIASKAFNEILAGSFVLRQKTCNYLHLHYRG